MKISYHLLTSESPKILKGEEHGWLTAALYLAPHRLAGGPTVCPWSTPGCRSVCLNTSGRGQGPQAQAARIRRTRLLRQDPGKFHRQLALDLERLSHTARENGLRPACRLNATSDLDWSWTIENWRSIQFYDYTKSPEQYAEWLRSRSPYYLTFSRSETNEAQCRNFILAGGNATVVFHGPIPDMYQGFPVINGDEHDLRFLDPPVSGSDSGRRGKQRRPVTGRKGS